MIKKTVFLLFGITFLHYLTGCGIYGPVYKKPKVNTPHTWYSKDNLARASKVNLPAMAWWRQFHDPELDKLVNLAIINNNDIQAAIGNVKGARGQLMQVQYSIIPSVNAFLLGYANKSINIFNPGYQSGFVPDYIFNLFQYMRLSEKAKAELFASKEAKDTVKLAVITQTIAGYFTYSGQTLLRNQQTTLVNDLNKLLYLSKMQYKDGLISLYTLQQYVQDYEKAKSELPIIKNNVVVARNALRLLLNRNPGPVGIGSQFMGLQSDGIVPANLPSVVLQNRPDVRGSQQKLIAANAQVGVVTSIFFPSISLTGLAGSASGQLSNLFTGNTGLWNRLEGLAVPLIAPEYPGLYKQAMGLRYTAYRDYIQVIRSAFKSVDDDLSAHQQYYRNLVAQTKNFSSSKEAFNLATGSFKQGLYSYPTLLVNKITMDNAAIELTKSKIAQLTTIVKLYEDLGAGYAYNNKTQG